MSIAPVYPWQHAQRSRVVDLRKQGKMPHALLLSGPRHLGKRDFATAMAAYLLCQSPREEGRCEACDNCHLVDAGTHPDLRIVRPEESKLIRIEQVRELIDWASQTSQRGGYKAIVIEPAEQMNVYAANALLKLLEEPADDTVMLLVSDLPGRLLPTIRSRCQHLPFAIPARQESLVWLAQQRPDDRDLPLMLEIAGGAPLAVISTLDKDFVERRRQIAAGLHSLLTDGNPLEVARTLGSRGNEAVADLSVLYSIVADGLRLTMSGNKKVIKNSDLKELLDKLNETVPARALFGILDAAGRGRLLLEGPTNPNPQLLFESLLVEIAEARRL